MTTAQDIITASMRKIGVARRGMTPDAADIADGLAALNRMISAWALENLMAKARTLAGYPLVSGQYEYTIGTGGNFNATRPEEIVGAWVRDANGLDYPVEIIPREAYEGTSLKSSPGRPYRLYYDPQYPLGIVKVWPAPQTIETIYLDQVVKLSEYATAATAVDLPPGYEDCLIYGLAVRLAPEYGITTPPEVAFEAQKLKERIKERNHQTPPAMMDSAVMALGQGSRYNIFTG
ncbi:MAG: hypothetical protein OEV92_03955 [Nitrospinota bacterium]|nr:hypothetical protein [Nitrospinota bacterium]